MKENDKINIFIHEKKVGTTDVRVPEPKPEISRPSLYQTARNSEKNLLCHTTTVY